MGQVFHLPAVRPRITEVSTHENVVDLKGGRKVIRKRRFYGFLALLSLPLVRVSVDRSE